MANGHGLTPVNTATNKAERTIPLGQGPDAVAITPNGKTVYVTNSSGNTVSPVSTATHRAGPRIPAGVRPFWIVAAPDGKKVFVLANNGVVPISTATNQPGKLIKINGFPQRMAITPNGKTLYVTTGEFNLVFPINTASGRWASRSRSGRAVHHRGQPGRQDGLRAQLKGNTVTRSTPPPTGPATGSRSGPSRTLSRSARTERPPTCSATASDSRLRRSTWPPTSQERRSSWRSYGNLGTIAADPNGKTLYVLDVVADTVTPIQLPSGTVGKPIRSRAALAPW